METKPTLLYSKLLAVQREMGAIKKDSTNPYFNSNYFDINSLLAQVKPILNKHDLLLTQALTSMRERVAIKTRITYAETGESIGDTVILPDITDPQKIGSMITYFRRYSLQSLLGLEAEDDDGNNASGKKATRAPKATVNTDEPPFSDQPDNFKI